MIEAAAVFAVNVLSSVLKKYVMPRFGKTGVQVVVFALAMIAAVYMNYGASVEYYVAQAIGIFALAVSLYEVLLSRITFFKGVK
jgi:hypothetical protein